MQIRISNQRRPHSLIYPKRPRRMFRRALHGNVGAPIGIPFKPCFVYIGGETFSALKSAGAP